MGAVDVMLMCIGLRHTHTHKHTHTQTHTHTHTRTHTHISTYLLFCKLVLLERLCTRVMYKNTLSCRPVSNRNA